jgi:ElaA protein
MLFSDLTCSQLYQFLKLRTDAFVVEQQCAYPELDDKDILIGTRHLMTIEEGKGNIIAYSRCLAPGVSYSGSSIGRVVIDPNYRSKGLAKDLVLRAIDVCKTTWPESAIEIGAQYYLLAFYESFGFQTIGEPYDEDGISHIDMRLK